MSNREQGVKDLILTAIAGCATCDLAYVTENVDIIGQRGDLWMFRVACPRCRKLGFVAALVNTEEATATEVLAPPERRHDGLTTPITGRDVLEMREYLADLDGNPGSVMAED